MHIFLHKTINYGHVTLVCICMQPYLFTFTQLKQLPKLFELFVKLNSNKSVFDRKQFSEIPIVREHKRALVV